MSAAYRLFGAETSAYSSKLRSYLRYKGVEHEWTPRTAASEADLSAAARFKTLPVLVTSSGHAVHDTTPMMEALEADQPEPSAVPETQAAAMIAAVLEDYADLWLSKAVMQYRWGRRKDQKEAAARAVAEYYGEDMPDDRKAQEKTAIERMIAEMPRIGLTPDVGGVVEKSFKRFVKLLNAHLERHLYLFGGRPCLADFALAGQLSQMLKDPTPAKIIEKDGPFVKAWCEFMDDPKPGGPFEPLEECLDTLTPIFKKEVCITFLPWAAANLEAAYAKNAMVEVSLGKDAVFHAPLRSSARSFRDVRRKFSYARDDENAAAFFDAVGATQYLERPPRQEIVGDGEDGGETRRSGRGGRPRRRRRGGGGRNRGQASSAN